MKLKHCLLAIGLMSATVCVAQPPTASPTRVVSEQDAVYEKYQWGELYRYYDNEPDTSRPVLVAVAIIDSGMEIHPSHEHSEEEYLMVIEGSGTWDVRGRTLEAHAGDVLYARADETHGITNTGDEPLKLLIFKWRDRPRADGD